MKRLVVVLSGLLVLPAFAEIAPIYYDDAIEMSDVDIVDENDAADDSATTQNNSSSGANVGPRTTGRATSSRAVAASTTRRANVTNSGAPSTRNLSTRASGTNTGTPARTTVSRAATTRAGAAGAPGGAAGTVSRGVVASRTIPTGVSGARNAAPVNTARASIVQTDTVNTPLYTGRVGTAGSVRARVPAIRMSSASSGVTTTTVESASTAAATMDELAQMTDFCKAQYTQCMDNFCNVLDDNQGRCSCSSNLKNYAKTEAALKEATENLQNVAQQIQYIGLSKDDVESLFNQTAAELGLASNSDSSQLKSDLDRIKNMIIDVKSGTASASTDTGLNFDLSGLLDFNISSTGFDLASLFGTGSNTSSISNQRGEQLYKTATARCKGAVLNSCQAQGVDVSVITNSYDLEIDKQCIAYERSLSDANDQMTSTVRNAKSVLQKARLMVAKQKNAYDMRACVNALDTCMQDDFVCGSDYENCLDPTGKYIVNGAVVSGSTPGVSGGGLTGTSTTGTGLYDVWNYSSNNTASNAFGNGNVAGFVDAGMYKQISDFARVPTMAKMAQYLQQKIGYVDSDGKSFGMCVSELNKCQNYTYTSTNSRSQQYKPDNDVVRSYLERVSMQIKAAQDEILANYAESCISDVSVCLSQNNYGSLAQTTTESGTVSAVAIAACRPVITTCMSVTGYNTGVNSDIRGWLKSTLNQSVTGDYTYSTYTVPKNLVAETECSVVGGKWDNTASKCEFSFPAGNVTKNTDGTWNVASISSRLCVDLAGTYDSGSACIKIPSGNLALKSATTIDTSSNPNLGLGENKDSGLTDGSDNELQKPLESNEDLKLNP